MQKVRTSPDQPMGCSAGKAEARPLPRSLCCGNQGHDAISTLPPLDV